MAEQQGVGQQLLSNPLLRSPVSKQDMQFIVIGFTTF